MEIKYDLSAEICVLATMLVDKTCFIKGMQTLDSRNFFYPENQIVFSSMIEIYNVGSFPTFDSLLIYLKQNDLQKKVGNNLPELTYASSVVDFNYYIDVLKTQRFKTDFASLVKKTQQDFSTKTVDELCQLVDLVRSGGAKTDFVDFVQIDKEMLEGRGFEAWLNDRQEAYERGEKVLGHSTGFPILDEIICGLQEGHYHTIAAEPGAGKTTFALQIILNLMQNKIKSCVLSLELSKTDIYLKMISIISNVHILEIKSGRLNGIAYHNVMAASVFLKQNAQYILVSEEPVENLASLKCYMQRAHDLGCKVIMIDYLQQIHHSACNPSEAIKEVSQTVQKLLLKFKMSGLILSQFAKDTQKVGLSADRLFGSSQIKKDSTSIMLLDPDFNSNTMRLNFDKLREGGSRRMTKFTFNGCSFEEMKDFKGIQDE